LRKSNLSGWGKVVGDTKKKDPRGKGVGKSRSKTTMAVIGCFRKREHSPEKEWTPVKGVGDSPCPATREVRQ